VQYPYAGHVGARLNQLQPGCHFRNHFTIRVVQTRKYHVALFICASRSLPPNLCTCYRIILRRRWRRRHSQLPFIAHCGRVPVPTTTVPVPIRITTLYGLVDSHIQPTPCEHLLLPPEPSESSAVIFLCHRRIRRPRLAGDNVLQYEPRISGRWVDDATGRPISTI
jgi:hypothetical protein